MSESPVWGGVVVAAGRSLRFGNDKTLTVLAGRSILARSITALLVDPRMSVMMVVTSMANADECARLIAADFQSANILTCLGGATRSESVRAGLAKLPQHVTHVAVHDAARPLVPATLVTDVLDAAEKTGAAVPVVPIASTLLVEGDCGLVAGSLPRDQVREAQTPQAARRTILEAALQMYPDETDESTALVRFGMPVQAVHGHSRNIKVTTPDDLQFAAALLAASERDD